MLLKKKKSEQGKGAVWGCEWAVAGQPVIQAGQPAIQAGFVEKMRSKPRLIEGEG